MTLRHMPDVYAPPGTPVAYIHDLPVDFAEASAFMAFQAGNHTPKDAEILAAWRVKMVLVHGTHILDRIAFINLEDVLRP
jgi:hypothetical protein